MFNERSRHAIIWIIITSQCTTTRADEEALKLSIENSQELNMNVTHLHRNFSSDITTDMVDGLINRTNIAGQKESKSVFVYMELVVVPCFTIPGLVGNVLSFYVLIFYRKKRPFHDTLAALAMSDSMFLLTVLVAWTASVYTFVKPIEGMNYFYRLLPYLHLYLIAVNGAISSYLTIVLTVDRLIAVVCPFFKRRHTRRNNIIFIVSIYITAYLAFCINFFKFDITETTNNITNVTILGTRRSSFYNNSQTAINLYSQICVTIFRICPLVLIVVCNVILVIYLKLSHLRRKRLFTDRARLNGERTTALVITISCTYALCVIPGMCSLLVMTVKLTYGLHTDARKMFLLISFIDMYLMAINASVNFVFYVSTLR